MTSEQVLAHIRETNLTYLELARKMLAADQATALVQLGISAASGAMLSAMSPQQMVRVCSGNVLLCSAHLGDELVWGLITSHGRRAAQNDPQVRAADRALADELLHGVLEAA